MMKKLGVAALFLLPFAAGCYAETYPSGYYAHYPHHHGYYRERAVYVAPAPPPRVYVAPPPPARYYY
jgi:hypothetical protein